MGTCGYEQRPPLVKIDKLYPYEVEKGAITANPRYDRFGEVQTLRSTREGMYRLIMAAKLGKNTVKMQTVSLECRILNSLADFQLYEGANCTLQSWMCPIIDPYDKRQEQVLFHITTEKKHNMLIKIYKFDNFRDLKLKQGIYEASLHQSLQRRSLTDHFIMSRGTLNAFVMVFRYFECSLLDLVSYRKQAQGYGWRQQQILFIWLKAIKGYRQLRQSNIFHRDLRLSNLLFTTANSAEPLAWANLSSARRITSSQLAEQDRQLLTVRGVSWFGEGLKGNIEAGEELSNYDPLKHDLACLERVLLAVLNLDPLEHNRTCNSETLKPLLARVRGASGVNELLEVEGVLQRMLREKEVNQAEMLLTDREISVELSKKLLPHLYKPVIDKVYLRYLLLLHKRDIFNKYLLDKMEENQKMNKRELNLDLLHQIGQYYENIGIADNDYYKEEITLVLDLAKEFRLEHFMKNHEEYIEKAIFLMDKYRYKGQDLKIKLKIEVVYSCLEADGVTEANQQLNQLLVMAHKQNTLQLLVQAQVLLAKAMVQTTNRNWQAAQTSLQRASMIVREGRNFVTQQEGKKLKGDLLLLEGYHYLRYLKEERASVPKPKYMGLADVSIAQALRTLTNLPQNPTNTVRIVDAYLLQAGLEIEREQLPAAKQSLESANLLLEELSGRHQVASGLRRMVFEKLKEVTSPTDHSYPTVCRRLEEFSKEDLVSHEMHQRILSQLAASRREEKKMKMLEKSIIIREEAAELEHDRK